MKEIIVFLAVLAVGFAAKFDPGCRVRFDAGVDIGKKFFYDVPRTKESAVALGWTKLTRPSSPLSSLEMYGAPPYTFCCMYDPETNFIAGMQVAIPLSKFTGAAFDWSIQGFVPWTDANGVKYMTKQIYFVNEGTLAKSKEERLKTAAKDLVLQEDKVWLTGFNKNLIAVSTSASGALQAGFTKQNCVPWMGTHYFYNMTTSTQCTADNLLNWFLLTDGDDFIGLGLIAFGVMPQEDGVKFFFERPAKVAVQAIVKNRPSCLDDLADDPTITTMHIYFIDKPWKVGCWLF